MRKSLITLAVAAVVVAAPINAKAVTANSFAAKCAEAAGTSKSEILGGINPSKSLTRQEAAVIAANAYYAKDAKTLAKVKKTEKYKAVKEFHRVKDVKSVKPEYRDAVRVVYSTGIDTGFRGAKYSTTRAFKPTKKLTSSKANTIVKRIASKSQRQVLTPDAQVCREAKTWNEKHEWKYVLETFPSSYYDKCLNYQRSSDYGKKVFYHSPKHFRDDDAVISCSAGGFTSRGKDYKLVNVLPMLQDDWIDLVKTNVETRLNYNYKTITDGKWVQTLYNTYSHFGTETDAQLRSNIQAVAKYLKANKIVCKSGKVVVDPWSMYTRGGGVFVRVYAKFKYVSGKPDLKNLGNDWVFSALHGSSNTGIVDNEYTVKKYGQWEECVFDVSLAPINETTSGIGVDGDCMVSVHKHKWYDINEKGKLIGF